MKPVRGLTRNIARLYSIMADAQHQFRTVIVEGNIASGKSVFLEYFKKFPDVKVFPEPVDKWRDAGGHNLLDLMYKNSSQWSFAFQMFADLTRIQMHQITDNLNPGDIKLMERSLYSGKYCFAENAYRSGKMDPAEYAVLNEYFHWWTKTHAEMLHVDLIVYLRTSPEVCYERLLKRHRQEEKTVPVDYLKSIHGLYEEWLIDKRQKLPGTLLVLDADNDLTSMYSAYDKVAERILN